MDGKRPKNTSAIDKIIKELSERDYKAAYSQLTEKQKRDRLNGKFHFCYRLGADTLEARDVRKDYLGDRMTKEEYLSYCMRYNLTTL